MEAALAKVIKKILTTWIKERKGNIVDDRLRVDRNHLELSKIQAFLIYFNLHPHLGSTKVMIGI